MEESTELISSSETIVNSTIMGFQSSTVVIVILILIINGNLRKSDKAYQEWDLVESIIAILFGWVGFFYIIITYGSYIFGHDPVKEKKKRKKDKDKEE